MMVGAQKKECGIVVCLFPSRTRVDGQETSGFRLIIWPVIGGDSVCGCRMEK